MLRSFLIYLSKAAWAQKLVTGWGIAWRAASLYINFVSTLGNLFVRGFAGCFRGGLLCFRRRGRRRIRHS